MGFKPNIKNMFSELNVEHFGGEIPDIPVVWNTRMTTTAGYCRYNRNRFTGELQPYQIDLSEKLFSNLGYDMDKVKNTLIHEMVHAFLLHKYNEKGHTARFQRMMTDITGVRKNHRCHSYDVSAIKREQKKNVRCECNKCGMVYWKARMPKHAAYSQYKHRGCGGVITFKKIS